MASVFRRSGSEIWTASVRVWDAASAEWTWQQRSTHVADKQRAIAIAVALENGSGEAKAGYMTKERAENLVSSIMQLAGLAITFRKHETLAYGNAFMDARTEAPEGEKAKVGDKTRRRYTAHWKAFRDWAGERVRQSLDKWTHQDFSDYYRHLRGQYWVTTANGHLATLSMIFHRAVVAGDLKVNPVALVQKVGDDTAEKVVFTRPEVAAVLRQMRKRQTCAWVLLTLLGWHTGHRIDDMLQRSKADVSRHPAAGYVLTFRPGKKQSRGGRTVVLPIPTYVAKMLMRLGDFKSIRKADNRNGRVSNDFVEWLQKSGIDPQPVMRGKRSVNLKSYHSFRHSMSSRMAAAGVDDTTSRLVTDHDSPKVHRNYVHAEVTALADALRKARRR